MAEPDRANLACAVYYAKGELAALNHAKENLLLEIEWMTVHHMVMLEHEEPVILNHAQQGLVRILHAAQAELFFGASARVQPARIDHGCISLVARTGAISLVARTGDRVSVDLVQRKS